MHSLMIGIVHAGRNQTLSHHENAHGVKVVSNMSLSSQLFGYFSGKPTAGTSAEADVGRPKSLKNRRHDDDDDDDDDDDNEDERNTHRSKRAEKETEQPDKSVDAVVEMCSGWVMIPISATLRSGNKRIKVPMMGGTPFATVNINDSDIATRPGAWAAVQRTLGYKVQSILDVCINPVIPTVSNMTKINQAVGGASNTFVRSIPTSMGGSATNQVPTTEAKPLITPSSINPQFNPALQLTRCLPDNIILPCSAVSSVGIFRLLLNHRSLIFENATALREIQGDPRMNISDGIKLGHETGQIALTASYDGRILPQTGTGLPHGDAILSTFPRLMSDTPLCRVFMYLWSLAAPKELGPSSNIADMTIVLALHPTALSLFKKSVLSLWKVSTSPSARADRLTPYESISAMYLREDKIREMAGLPAISRTPVTSYIPDTLKPMLGPSRGNSVTLNEKASLISPLISSITTDSRPIASQPNAVTSQPNNGSGGTATSGTVSEVKNNKLPISVPPPDKYLYSPFNPRELMYTQRNFHTPL